MWKALLKNALTDFANWRSKRQSRYQSLKALAWMISNLPKKKQDQLEKCPQFAHKLLNAYTWHEQADLTFHGQ